MPGTVQDLTKELLRAIDLEGNVHDMGAVEEVVSGLERSPVTAEDLKATRLGKHVNAVRRKLAGTNRKLAKRMKNLVKQWQHLLQNRTPNGVATAGSTTSPSAPIPAPAPLSPPSVSTFTPARATQNPSPAVNRTKVQQMLSKLKKGPQQTTATPTVPPASSLDSLCNSISNSPLQASKSPSPVPPSNGTLSEGCSSALTLSFPLNSCTPRQRAPAVAGKKVNSLVVKLPRQHLRVSRTDGSSTGTKISSWEGNCATSAVHELPAAPTTPLSLLVSIDTSLLLEASSTSQTHIPLPSKDLTQHSSTQALNGLASLSPELDSPYPHLKPTGLAPGVDGCLGQDGFWYNWTQAIPSEGFSVVVLPYVYIDGLEPTELL